MWVSALWVLIGFYLILGSGSATAALVEPSYSVAVYTPGQTNYYETFPNILYLAESSSSCPLFGGCQTSMATADILTGSLHAYAEASGGGVGFGDAALSVPVVISGSVAGLVAIKMMVHGTWQVSTTADPHLPSVINDGQAQFVGYLKRPSP